MYTKAQTDTFTENIGQRIKESVEIFIGLDKTEYSF